MADAAAQALVERAECLYVIPLRPRQQAVCAAVLIIVLSLQLDLRE